MAAGAGSKDRKSESNALDKVVNESGARNKRRKSNHGVSQGSSDHVASSSRRRSANANNLVGSRSRRDNVERVVRGRVEDSGVRRKKKMSVNHEDSDVKSKNGVVGSSRGRKDPEELREENKRRKKEEKKKTKNKSGEDQVVARIPKRGKE